MKQGIISVLGSFYVQCDVLLIPTQDSRLALSKGQLHYTPHGMYNRVGAMEPQHMYIVRTPEDEFQGLALDLRLLMYGEIRNIVGKSSSKGYENWFKADNNVILAKDQIKELIATTDKMLWRKSRIETEGHFLNQPVARPSNSFLEAYVRAYNKGAKIEKVLVECYIENEGCIDSERAEIRIAPDSTITIKPIKSHNKDVEHLDWIYNRLKFTYSEDEDIDYMLKFKEIIDKLRY